MKVVKGEIVTKNVLILGASGDIGRAISKQLALENYSLILHYHQNKTSIEKLMKELAAESVLQTIQADLKKPDEIKRLCHHIFSPVHAIIYVSGTAHFGLFQDVPEQVMDEMLSLHVKAPWIITQHFLPSMIQNKSGKIIFITSLWGSLGASNEVIYSAVKGAQNSFVKALAKEVGPSGVLVNAVSPGFIDTKMNRHFLEDEREDIIAHIPLNRAGLSSDVAHTVSFLMNEKSNYIQGEIINITGGW